MKSRKEQAPNLSGKKKVDCGGIRSDMAAYLKCGRIPIQRFLISLQLLRASPLPNPLSM